MFMVKKKTSVDSFARMQILARRIAKHIDLFDTACFVYEYNDNCRYHSHILLE